MLLGRGRAVVEVPQPARDRAVVVAAGVGEDDGQPGGREVERGHGRLVDRRRRRPGEAADCALPAGDPGISGRVGGDRRIGAEAGSSRVHDRPVQSTRGRIEHPAAGGRHPELVRADHLDVGELIRGVGGRQHLPGETPVATARRIAVEADRIADAGVPEIHVLNCWRAAGKLALRPGGTAVEGAIERCVGGDGPAARAGKVHRHVGALEVGDRRPGGAAIDGVEERRAIEPLPDDPAVEERREVEVGGGHPRRSGCGRSPGGAGVGAAVDHAAAIDGHDGLRSDDLHGLEAARAQGGANQPGRGAGGAGQNLAGLPDGDQIAVGETVHGEDRHPRAARNLVPGHAAVGRLDDEAGAEAEIARLGVGEDRCHAAEEAGSRARRGVSLCPGQTGIGGAVEVPRAIGRDHDSSGRNGEAEGSGERSGGNHLSEVGPGRAAVGRAEDAVVVVGMGTASSPGQGNISRDGKDAAPALGRRAARPGDTAIGRADQVSVDDAHRDRRGEECHRVGHAGLHEGERGAAVGGPIEAAGGDAEPGQLVRKRKGRHSIRRWRPGEAAVAADIHPEVAGRDAEAQGGKLHEIGGAERGQLFPGGAAVRGAVVDVAPHPAVLGVEERDSPEAAREVEGHVALHPAGPAVVRLEEGAARVEGVVVGSEKDPPRRRGGNAPDLEVGGKRTLGAPLSHRRSARSRRQQACQSQGLPQTSWRPALGGCNPNFRAGIVHGGTPEIWHSAVRGKHRLPHAD